MVTTSIDELWGSALTAVSASESHKTGAEMRNRPKEVHVLGQHVSALTASGVASHFRIPTLNSLVYLLDFWVLGKQMACFLLSHLPSCPVPHTAGCGEVTLPFFFAATWKQLHLCHFLPPILTELVEVLLLDFLSPIWQQAVGVVCGQGWVSYFPPRSPPFPCNNAVTWWSESVMPFYLPKYTHSLWGKVRLTNESWIPPVDQLLC